MSLLIERSVVRDFRTCFDSWASIRQHVKPPRHQMPSEERWAGQISMPEILEGKLKTENFAWISFTLVSTPLPVITPRDLLCRDISFYNLARELDPRLYCFEGLDCIGHHLAAEISNFFPFSTFFPDDLEQMYSVSAEVNISVLISRDAKL